MWHSVAELHERWHPQEAKLKVFKYSGGGWSRDREESQCKAVTEAVERWAFRFYSLHSPAAAALDLDPTTNGFAALPTTLGKNRATGIAYCEAVERWIMSRIWDHGNFALREIFAKETAVTELFPKALGAVRYFQAELIPAFPAIATADRLYFVLCLVKTASGGVLPGSACGLSPDDTLMRAACEARIHFNMNERMDGIDLTNLIERRLRYFAENRDGFELVSRRLVISEAPPLTQAPPAISIQHLPGEWEPDISVCRVMVEQTQHIQEGGIERFLI